jgi:diguanylate cyclase (GGDEF)-like protein/PAS domain S-box-containing protein
LGVLSVNNNSRFEDFTRNDETLLSFLADYAAIAIVNTSSFEKARKEIEERKKVESELRESEERYALAVRGSNDGIWDWDLTTNLIYFSPRWKEMLGYSENEIQGNANEWFSRIHQDDLQQFKLEIYNHLHNRSSHFTNEHRLGHKNGSDRWVLCRGMAVWKSGVEGSQGAVRLAGSISDITEWKAAENRLLHDALHDPLTTLPNRVLFGDRLNQAIERSRRREDYQFAVLFLDLDDFKVVNDTIGHMIGDQLLIKVGEILASGLRPADTIARFAGDEFIILLDDIGDRTNVDHMIDWVKVQFDQVIKIEEHEIKTSASIGVVLCDSGETVAEDIIRNADIAMYAAKAKGKDRAETYEPALRRRFLERLNLEIDLRKAIESNEFVVHYQPILGLEDRALLGFEALVRWQHPKKGLLYPKDFINLAEETDLIVGIGHWVLREACGQMAAWNQRFTSSVELSISINISGRHINNPDLPIYIQRVLEETGLHPRNLKLEITELSIVDQSEFTVRSLSKLHEMGVQLQIDDFGIGYSSLSYLSRFPINALKIDKSFVLRMGIERNQVDIIRAIITLSDRLNVDVIAEGIETQDQLNALLGLQCKLGQGFLLSHPLDPGEVEAVLANLPQDEKGRLIWMRDEE